MSDRKSKRIREFANRSCKVDPEQTARATAAAAGSRAQDQPDCLLRTTAAVGAPGSVACADRNAQHEQLASHKRRRIAPHSNSLQLQTQQQLALSPGGGHSSGPTGPAASNAGASHQHTTVDAHLAHLPELQQHLTSQPAWQQNLQLTANNMVCVRTSYRGHPVWTVQDARTRQQTQHMQFHGSAAQAEGIQGHDGQGRKGKDSLVAAPAPRSAPAMAAAADEAGDDCVGSTVKRAYMFAYLRTEGTWRAAVVLPRVATRLLGLRSSNKVVPIANKYPTAEHAARAADLAQLALLGPWHGMKLNFPIGDYTAAEQQPKTGTELARYFLWLKGQATAVRPFAGCLFTVAPATLPGGHAAASAAGGSASIQQQQQARVLRQPHGRPFQAQSVHCGLCTGCLLKRACVASQWQQQEAAARKPGTAAAPSAEQDTDATAIATAAAAAKTAASSVVKAERLLQVQHRTLVRIISPSAVKLFAPGHQAAAHAVAAAPSVASAAVAEAVDRSKVCITLPYGSDVSNHHLHHQQQQQQPSTCQHDNEADALAEKLLSEACWHDADPAAATAAVTSAVLTASQHPGTHCPQYGGLPALPWIGQVSKRKDPTAQPSLQPDVKQRLVAASAAADAGLISLVLNAVPKATSCRQCMSLQHGSKSRRAVKCPIHHLAAPPSKAPRSACAGEHQQQQQQPGWMTALGPEGVQLTRVLRHLADQVLAPELDRIKEVAQASVRGRRWNKRRQQQQQQHGKSMRDFAAACGPLQERGGGAVLDGSQGEELPGAMDSACSGSSKELNQCLPVKSGADTQKQQQQMGGAAGRALMADEVAGRCRSAGDIESEGWIKGTDGPRHSTAHKGKPGAGAGAAAGVGAGVGLVTTAPGCNEPGIDPWSFVAAAVVIQEMARAAVNM